MKHPRYRAVCWCGCGRFIESDRVRARWFFSTACFYRWARQGHSGQWPAAGRTRAKRRWAGEDEQERQRTAREEDRKHEEEYRSRRSIERALAETQREHDEKVAQIVSTMPSKKKRARSPEPPSPLIAERTTISADQMPSPTAIESG